MLIVSHVVHCAPTISVKTKWTDVDQPNAWYRTCEITFQNLTDRSVDRLPTSFELNVGTPTPHTGFTFSVDKTKVRGYLQDWKLPLSANGEQDFKIGINFSEGNGVQGELPKNFLIEGQEVSEEKDTAPPTIPQNLRTTFVHAYSAGLAWDASQDNIKVEKYTVYYQDADGNTRTTDATNTVASLQNLLASHTYKVHVCSIDTSENVSAPSHVLDLTTLQKTEDPSPVKGLFGLPFVDNVAYPTPDLNAFAREIRVQGFIAGFVVLGQGKPCWGGHAVVYNSLTGQNENGDARVSNYQKQFFQEHPDSLISIGGAAGLPLSADPTLTAEDLAGMYKEIMNNYKLSGLDFDFEGGFLADSVALERHLRGIHMVIKERPQTKLVYTLPVDGSTGLQGFNYYGENFLKQLHSFGIEPTCINGMLMEFGQGSSENLYEASVVALEGMHKYLRTVFTQWDDGTVWAHIGATPMFGRNNNGKIFTLSNQKDLNAFCKARNMVLMSGWDMIRDMRFTAEELGLSSHMPGDFARTISEYPH